METRSEKLMRAFKNCSLVYKGQTISDYSLLEYSAGFFTELAMNGINGRGLILHPGSNAELLIMTMLFAFTCLLFDNRSHDDVIQNLNVGDLVVYGKSRGVFKGINEQGMAMIEQAHSILCYVPQTAFYKIRPYNGNATTLDGRGLRENPAEKQTFLSLIFGTTPAEIPSVINRSVVIVCNRQEADSVMNDTEISVKDGNKTALRNLFPAAYYTPSDVYYYAGNSAKLEPVIKFTGKISVARELMIEDHEKNIIGLLVNGRDIIDAGISELTGLLSRKSLRNVILISRIDDGDYRLLLNEFDDLKLFAWTKDAILSSKLNMVDLNSDELKKLNQYVENIIEKEITLIKKSLDLDINFRSIKKNLFNIAYNEFTNNEKESFVINGFSLLNLLTYSIFPLKDLERQIAIGKIDIVSPEIQLENLNTIAGKFEGSLGDSMALVVKGLSNFYKSIYLNNPKYNTFLELFYENYRKGKKTAVVVPKEYYKIVLESIIPDTSILQNCEFITKNRFQNKKLYDQIIVTGVFESKKFNIFGTNASANIDVLAYNFEESKFKALNKLNNEISSFYDSRNYLKYDTDIYIDLNIQEDTDAEFLDIDGKLERYLDDLFIKSTVTTIKQAAAEGQATVEVSRLAIFETGERAFFTKNYSPYVFDSGTGIVNESEVSKLVPGDILIFTKYSDETKDIVEKILSNLVGSEACDNRIKESYRKTLYWKETLRKYMLKNSLSFRELSDRMYELGRGKHETTLRSWLDEDSHIVGPRDRESFYAIALITGDSYLLENPDEFCEACQDVRSMRIRILKYIGLNIINSVGGNTHETDKFLQALTGDISKFAVTLRIENIIDTREFSVPSYLANRPHEFQSEY